ncbi:MAG: signal recognition particle-docking protein FtsY [Planctomycetota bacterium]|nr:signal recognition particle-docking protein FtsY [Planctomycetota bacterium]
MVFSKVQQGLTRTRNKIGHLLRSLSSDTSLEDTIDNLEELLFTADVGPLASELLEKAEAQLKSGELARAADIPQWLREELSQVLLGPDGEPLPKINSDGPTVVLVAGVNGAGKTTSIAKLCHWLNAQGNTVMVGACDTFRAAAVKQLQVWCERTGTQCIAGQPQSDPASVAHDAAQAAIAQKADYLIIDTAGRLHNQKNLMAELNKVSRVLERIIPSAPHHSLLVLDATTGQNAIQQAKLFGECVPISGIVLSKLDGTAKGGATLSISKQLSLPVLFIGLGEGKDDLEVFNPSQFIDALFTPVQQ